MANRRVFSCLVLALCSLSVLSADVFISIDCGSSSSSYTDENGIVWTGDEDKYIQNGESRSVQSSNSVSRVMDTLRVFTNRIKNCYYIDSVKQGRVLVRATFHYGNYDGKSSPPTFDLQFDGNHWATVKTSSSQPVGYEVIYVMKNDSISICVARMNPGQFPFISALEIRVLESFMYQYIDASYPLFTVRRFAFGSNATIRYEDDPYDRIWSPESNNGSIQVSSDARFSKLVISPDRPPPATLKQAISATSPNTSIGLLFLRFLPDHEVPVYINWYFSEVTQLKQNETRSFQILKDNKPFSEPILPPYDNCTQLYNSNLTISSNTTLSLVPTNDSTLPPLINALELLVVGDELTNGTNTKDVQGLASMQKAFAVLQGWSGDPCLPAPYTWDWLECSDDPTPRVTALFLGSFGLSGSLPNFSSMDALRTIDLHNNSLRGPIPDFLGTLPNLKILNLTNNQFNGTIPASLSTKKGLTLVVAGNPDLCISGTSCPARPDTSLPSSSTGKKNKNVLEILFFSIITFIIILQLRHNSLR